MKERRALGGTATSGSPQTQALCRRVGSRALAKEEELRQPEEEAQRKAGADLVGPPRDGCCAPETSSDAAIDARKGEVVMAQGCNSQLCGGPAGEAQEPEGLGSEGAKGPGGMASSGFPEAQALCRRAASRASGLEEGCLMGRCWCWR